MTRKVCILLGLAGLPLWISCGGENPAAAEYSRIRNSGLPGEALVSSLEDFALRYPGHFDSKVELGIYYLAVGETGRAKDYLRRAEADIDGGESPAGRGGYTNPGGPAAGEGTNIPVMYGALGQIYLDQGDYERALDYADRAIKADREKRDQYRFLKGHVLIARRDYGPALAVFDEVFRGAGEEPPADPPGQASVEALRAYLFLLAQAERQNDAAAVLDRYFETGAFFPGLGTFAAAVYRAAGERERAAYALFLEREYRSGYGALEQNPQNGARDLEELSPPPGGFFAAEYLLIKDYIGRAEVSEDQYRRYLELESYFRLFPSYYWNLWLGARLLYPEDRRNFAPALQKIIALDKDGPLARDAWEELTRLLGY
jgi:tetratricopeptide (TPR) repeat protein